MKVRRFERNHYQNVVGDVDGGCCKLILDECVGACEMYSVPCRGILM
jgi:hypothetical protein